VYVYASTLIVECVTLNFRYLNTSALEEHFAGKDTVDDIKKTALDVGLHLTAFYIVLICFK